MMEEDNGCENNTRSDSRKAKKKTKGDWEMAAQGGSAVVQKAKAATPSGMAALWIRTGPNYLLREPEQDSTTVVPL